MEGVRLGPAVFNAGLLEVGWALGPKYTDGFTRLWPGVAASWRLRRRHCPTWGGAPDAAARHGYAVRTGIGTADTAVLGIVLFRDPATAAAGGQSADRGGIRRVKPAKPASAPAP